MSKFLRSSRNIAFSQCPDTGCDWSSFWRGWQAAFSSLGEPAGYQLKHPCGRVTLETSYPEWASNSEGYFITELFSIRLTD